jgi:RNA polymerase sigma factor (TIGR02999 family)
MSHERSDHTLQATALVNEVFLKIVSSGAQFHNEDHFIAACVAAMRQVLIDHARKRSRLKRKHSGTELPADQVVLAYGASSREVLEIDDAIRRLAELDPESAKVVELRFFGGLSWDGVRKAAHVSKREARSRWEFARRWLHRELYK